MNMDLFVLPIAEAAQLPEGYCASHFPDRLARSRQMHALDRLRCIAAGALIAHAMGICEKDLIRGEYGKIDVRGDLHFNLSHSGDYAILARHTFDVGADIECIRNPRERLAPRVLLPDEIEWMQRDPQSRFYTLWTIKESVLKLTGKGLAMPMQSFSAMPILMGQGMPLGDRMVYGASMRIGDCAAAICAWNPFEAPEPVMLTASAILQARH